MYINKKLLKVTFSVIIPLLLFFSLSFINIAEIKALETQKYIFEGENLNINQSIKLEKPVDSSSYLIISGYKRIDTSSEYIYPINIIFNNQQSISTTFSTEGSTTQKLNTNLVSIPSQTELIDFNFNNLVSSNEFSKIEVEIISNETQDVSGEININATGETYRLGEANIVSRDGWGCKDHPDGADSNSDYFCDDPFWGTSYYDTTHITVHHTATSNSSSNWAGEVRAIWYYHSHIRDADPEDGVQGWTDIGYHYLIDPNGVIYEGRYGNRIGEGVLTGQINTGGHVIGSNRGNIGIALIGDFTNQAPTKNAVISLSTLMQALINRHGLNPNAYAVSDSGQTKPVITGHRDWTATACPGNQLYPLLSRIHLYSGSESILTPTHRFWSPDNQRHFYTISYAEKILIMNNYPENIWKYEGIAFNANRGSNSGGDSLVYRFYSESNNSHFFTISRDEKELIERTYPDNIWRYEGIAFYAYTGAGLPEDNRKEVYRFWSPDNQTHFFTISRDEKELIERTYPDNIWRYEGVAYYVG